MVTILGFEVGAKELLTLFAMAIIASIMITAITGVNVCGLLSGVSATLESATFGQISFACPFQG